MSTVGVCGGGGGRGGSGGGEGWLCGRTWRSYKVHKNVAAQLLIADRGVCVAGPRWDTGGGTMGGVGWGGEGRRDAVVSPQQLSPSPAEHTGLTWPLPTRSPSVRAGGCV